MTAQQKVPARDGRRADDEVRARLLAELPVALRRVEVAGTATAVLEGGTGRPMVLLHGGIETGGVVWAPVMSRLAGSHRLVVPDVPGLGGSEPFGRMDKEAFSDWLAALIQQTCDEHPTLIAHSLLGSLAARFAAHRGDLLRGLVLYGAPGVGHYRIPLGLMITAIQFNVRPSERANAKFADWAFLDPEWTRRRDPEWYDAFMAYGFSRGTIGHVQRTMRQLVKAGSKQVSDAELQAIPVPTALVWGRRDRMVPLRIAELASARFGWPLQVVDDAGHVPHIERPKDFLGALHAALPEP